MRRYGLIGYPLEHSFSKDYFTSKFRREAIDARYDNFPLKTIDEFPGLIEQYPDLAGLNVTMPYKSAVMKYLDDVDKKALHAGAVNVISVVSEGNRKILKGYNTDIDGFMLSLKPMLLRKIQRALVLGTGGASRAVRAGLDDMGITYSVVSRYKPRADLTYAELTDEVISNCQLIINATPLGMFPDTENAPDIPYGSLTPDCILYDLVYKPEKSLFLKLGQERGCRIKNGKEMLLIQADKAWEIWKA
ncbi:MAG: shikimate dehydrogenase [Bacteroidota bacterium]|nr:shikimate dehydrogenase [Bacteroidota bacterium]